MIRTLLVLALAGWVLAAGPPSPTPLAVGQEQWKFTGKIMTGVSNPRQTFAGTVLDIDILIDRLEDKSMDVTFSKVTSRDFNKQMYIGEPSEADVGGSDRARGYMGEKKDVKELEGTFKAFLDRERGTVMEVPVGEQIWVTNVRKAIMNMMKVPPYTGDRHFVDLERNAFNKEHNSRAAEERISFKKREHIFAGICNVSYTMTPDANDGHWKGSPENVIPGDGEFFRLRRSVDFDSCLDVVNFQKTSVGNFSQSYKGQMKEVKERSTYGEYLMKKNADGSFQLKGIMQTGDTIVRPFGQDTGRVIVHSNQTMSLQSLRHSGESRPRVQARQSEGTKPVNTWFYQFTSPASPDPRTEVDWVIYEKKEADQPIYPEYAVLGGAYFHQEDIMSRARSDLDTITKLQLEQVVEYEKPYRGTTDGRLTHLLKVLAHSIRALTRENVEKLFAETAKDSTPSERVKRQSFLDAVAASGSAQGIQELIKAANAKKIPLVRMGGLMAHLTNNIMDPSALKDLMDYVVSLNQESKYLEMMAHLNFAKMARRVCFDEQKKNYSVPQAYLGNRRCNKEAIETVFVSHLKNKIQSSPETWRKMMYTHALGLLGLEDTIPYLCNLATGQDPNSSPSLRMGAIYSLTHHFNRGQKREKVLRQLLPIAESHTEDFEIREIAFIAVMYMKPNATLLQRFAFHSWRDPSSQMKSLISSVFLSLAQSNDPGYKDMTIMARQLLPMLQLNQPSLQNSLFFDYKERLPDVKIGFTAKYAWASTHPSKLSAPRQILADLKAEFGGIVVPIIKVYTMLDLDMSRLSPQSPSNAHNAHQKMIHQELAELSADLEIEQKQGKNEAFMYASSFNYEFFFAPSSQMITAAKQKVKSLLETAVGKAAAPFYPDQTVKFFNLVDVVSILPTPFGTPSIVEVAAPNNWLSDYDYVVKKAQAGDEYNVTVNGLSKMVMKTQSLMKVMMPWHNKTAVAGIDTEHSVNLPGKLSMLIGEVFPYPLLKCTISPVFRDELPLVYSRSKPLSALQPIEPTADLSSSEHIVSPAADPNARYKRNFDVPIDLLGLKSRVTYEGDVAYPFLQSHLMRFVVDPERLVTLLTTPTQKEYALSYRLNIDESETKNITVAALLLIKENHLPSHMPLDGTLEEVGQKIAQRLSIKDSMEEQLAKAKNGEFGDFTISLAVNYTTPNVRTRQYELALTGTNITKPDPTGYQQNLVLNIMSMGRPEHPQQNKVCFVTSISEKLKPTESAGRKSELYTTAEMNVFAGKDCSPNEKVGQSEFRLHLKSDDRQDQRKRSLRGGLFIGPEGRAPWIADAFYNKLDMELKSFSEMPPFCQNLTNRFQDLAYGYMFPHVTRNRLLPVKGQERTVIVNVTRSTASNTVDAKVQSPEELAIIEQLNVAPIFDWATPLLGPHQLYNYHKNTDGLDHRRTLQEAGGRRCKISAQQVTTYDDVSFKKTPTTCWTVATQVQHQQDTFAVMSRQDKSSAQSEKEVQILLPLVGKIEVLKGQQVKMNGQVITGSKALKDTSGKVIGSVNTTSDRIIVSVPSKLEVVLQDKTELTITLAEKYRSFMNGMCGDFNGEQAADLRSPKGCIYPPSKGPVFAATWVAKKSSCEDPAMQALLEEARQDEQSNCHKSLSSNRQRGQNRQQGRRQ